MERIIFNEVTRKNHIYTRLLRPPYFASEAFLVLICVSSLCIYFAAIKRPYKCLKTRVFMRFQSDIIKDGNAHFYGNYERKGMIYNQP